MIFDYLSLFGRFGKVFKAILYDSDKTEKQTISNINDINKGGIHNAIEWHMRVIYRLLDEFPLTRAKGFLLRDWGRFLGIVNDEGLGDDDYRAKIIARLLSIVGTKNIIKGLIPETSDVYLREGNQMGWFLDVCYLDTPAYPDKMVGAVFAFQHNALYILFRTLYDINLPLLRSIYELKSAGIGVFAGTIVELPTLTQMYLNYGFIDRDYLGE
ncbi:hypothetical protein ND864_17485 [Leptospira levettii]|uniref:hypothetical protein n=1 Tax=Leptospira levettii TaxID=2023178 RepID=UPI00223CAFAC|nr:hypothetical protein [Leptospira levettii]MCW7467516.1 hypothetical protein [Leptospira levettii]